MKDCRLDRIGGRADRRPAEMLHALMQGLPRDALADHLGVTENTIRTHVNLVLDGRFAHPEALHDDILAHTEEWIGGDNWHMTTIMDESGAREIIARANEATRNLDEAARLLEHAPATDTLAANLFKRVAHVMADIEPERREPLWQRYPALRPSGWLPVRTTGPKKP